MIRLISVLGQTRQEDFIKNRYDSAITRLMGLKESEAMYRIQNEVNKSTSISGEALSVFMRKANPGIDETNLRTIVNNIVG